jgi:hypothetical protein
MAFVQITKSATINKETFEQVHRDWTGGGLADGELWLAAGKGDEGFYVIDAWESREKCEAAFARLMPILQKAGLSIEDMTVEEFDIDTQVLG